MSDSALLPTYRQHRHIHEHVYIDTVLSTQGLGHGFPHNSGISVKNSFGEEKWQRFQSKLLFGIFFKYWGGAWGGDMEER